MSRSPKFDFRSATEWMLVEAMERLEVAQIPVYPELEPDHSAARQALARACLGAVGEFDSVFAELDMASAHGSRATRH